MSCNSVLEIGSAADRRIDVSVIIPCFNEVRFIKQCLHSLLLDSIEYIKIEFIVVDGGSDDGTFEEVIKIKNDFPYAIRLLHNKERIAAAALNIGIRESKGKYVARVDAHAEYPQNYLHKLFIAAEQTGSDNLGYCVDTVPSSLGNEAVVVADILSSKLGVGDSNFRVRKNLKKPMFVDTVPFGFFRRDLFGRIGLFDEELVRNQDDEFNARIIRDGGKIILLSGERIKYYARSNLRNLWKMLFQYGLFKPLVNSKIGSLTSWRQLAPPFLVISSLLIFSVAMYGVPYIHLLILPYLLLVLLVSLSRYGANFIKVFIFSLGVIGAHFSYGVGYIIGLIYLLFGLRRKSVHAVSR